MPSRRSLAFGMGGAVEGAFLLAAIAIAWPAPARAQIGSGWTEYRPDLNLQIRGCAAHSESGGVHQFRVTCAATSGDNRAEHRILNEYSSGTNQFEGEIRVVENGTNIIVKQTFMPNMGAHFMLAVSADGRLYLHGGGGNVASNVVGRWIRINTLHDVAAGTIQVYADGVLATTKTGGRQVTWHDKYGSYRSQSGRGPAVVEWRNVRYWRGGRATGGAPPPPRPDAGTSPDVRVTDATAGGTDGPGRADTGAGGVGGGTGGMGGTGGGGAGGAGGAGGGAGGAGGTGGAGGGAGGTGGRGGSGGAGGTPGGGSGGTGTGGTVGGGSGGTGGADPGSPDAGTAGGGKPPVEGCSCALGGVRQTSGGAGLLGVILLAGCWSLRQFAGRSRRRRSSQEG